MKLRNILLFFVSLLLLSSCLEDNTELSLKDINLPSFDYDQDVVTVDAIIGKNAKLDCRFHYESKDNEELMKNSKYEWFVNNILISEEKNLDMSTTEIMSKIDMVKLPTYALSGMLKITNPATNAKAIQKIRVNIKSNFNIGTWLLLSKNNGNSKLSYINSFMQNDESGKRRKVYEKYDDIIQHCNGDEVKLIGNPIKLVDYSAPHISSSMGATTVITDKVAWNLNNENLKFVNNVYDEFIDGNKNLNIVDVYYDFDIHYSFVITKEGEVYMRKFSKNHLGGSYISKPIFIDEKGYDIKFASDHGDFTNSSAFYDQKNHRLVSSGKNNMILPIEKVEGNHLLDVTQLPQDIKVLGLSKGGNLTQGSAPRGYTSYFLFYKKGDKFFCHEFVINCHSIPCKLTTDKVNTIPLNGKFKEDSKIWMPGFFPFFIDMEFWYAVFYTSGNEIRMFDRMSKEDKLIYRFDHKITAANFDTNRDNPYTKLGVGLENGDFYVIDPLKKTILEEASFNTGGEIVDISILGGADYK